MKPKATHERVLEVLESTPTSEKVRIRNLYDPMFAELWRIAGKRIKEFHTDIIHDALMLAHSEAGEKLLWGWRETGTTMIRLKNYSVKDCMNIVQASNCPANNWYVLEVKDTHKFGHTSGYVVWINAHDFSKIEQVVLDNI